MISPLVEEAQKLTVLVNEHLDILECIAETGLDPSKLKSQETLKLSQ